MMMDDDCSEGYQNDKHDCEEVLISALEEEYFSCASHVCIHTKSHMVIQYLSFV